jgi:hypothetical protein
MSIPSSLLLVQVIFLCCCVKIKTLSKIIDADGLYHMTIDKNICNIVSLFEVCL